MKYQIHNILAIIAGSLILQFTANAQSTFPIIGDGVSITNPSPSALNLNAVGENDNASIRLIEEQMSITGQGISLAAHDDGLSLSSYHGINLHAGESGIDLCADVDGIRLRSPDGDINLSTNGYNINLSSGGNINLSSNGDFNLSSGSGAISITGNDDNAIISLQSSHVKSSVQATDPDDLVRKDQFDAAIAKLSGVAQVSGTINASQLVSNFSFITGNAGINTGQHTLTVNGTIRAKEVIVDSDWADDVFSADYKLQSLSDVNEYIKQNKHLPGMPSAEQVKAKGVDVGEAQTLLLRKIEEITLHMITLENQVKELKAENADLQRKLSNAK